MSVDKKISQLPVATTVNTTDYTVMVDGNTSTNKRATVAQILAAAGGGTVTSVGITGTDGIAVTNSPITSSGSITLALGSITPDAVTSIGAISGSNLSGTNTGDQTITLSSDVAGSGTSSITTTIQPGVVTNAKLANMTGPTVKGRSSGTGVPSDLDMSTLNGMLPDMVGDSGSGGTHGLVPAPTSGSTAAKKFLRADATWVAPDANDLLPSQAGNSGKVLSTNGSTTSWAAAGVGSVTSVSVTTANGVSGTVATSTTTPAISLTLGAITPSSVAATGTVTGTNLSGSNTGDQTISITGDVTASGSTGALTATVTKINGTSLASLGTGIVKNTTGTGVPSIAVAADFPTLNQNTTGTASNVTGTVAVANGGTGQTTANAAFNALAPTQSGNSGKYLTTDGSNTSWATNPLGTVTSVGGTGTVSGISLTGTVTTSGNLTLGGTLDLSSPPAIGGTTPAAGTFTDAFATTLSTGFTSVAAAGTVTTLVAASVRDWTVTGSGGQTYQLPDATTLRNGAMFQFNNNQSSGTVVVRNNSATTIATLQSGSYVEIILLSNSIAAGSWDVHNQAPSNVSWSTNTFDYPGSVTSATWNGVAVAINRGGTGQATAQLAINALAGAVTSGSYLRGNGTNVVMNTIQAADVPTLNQNTTGTAANVTGTVAVANGGTGSTTASGARTNLGLVIGTDVLAPNGSAASLTGFPTFNQNTTGTASNVTGTVAVSNGGTGATTASAARTSLGVVIGTDVLAPTGSAASLTSLTGASAGTYGSTTTTVTIIIDSTGRITSVTSNTIPTYVGDSGSGGTKGFVPAAAAGDGANKKALLADGTWGYPKLIL